MGRKALGRGLSALLGDESKTIEKEELTEIDLDLIDPNSQQPRTSFEEEGLEELAQSIRVNGIVQPIIVRRRGARFQIIAGERRWRASQRAELQKIPAIVKEIEDDRLLEIALIENIQRQELNTIEEARAYQNMIKTLGLTQEMIAERVGKSRTAITTSLRFLRLPKDIQILLEEGKINSGHARALLMAKDEDFQRRLARKIMELSLSVRETEKAVKRGKKSPQSIDNKTVTGKKDANVKAAETKLRRHLGTNVHINENKKGAGGKIEIEFYGKTDLDRIYSLILGKK